jgi:DNA transposition AAA+ family ATPase
MEAVARKLNENKNFNNMTIEEIGEELKRLRENEGITFEEISKQINISRSYVSTLVNQHRANSDVMTAIRKFLYKYYEIPEDEVQDFKKDIEIFPTTEFKKALGFIEDIRNRRKMGCMIGYPGSGKTTIIKEYAGSIENVIYIEAFQGMREKDLLEIIAENLGIALKRGSAYKLVRQIIDEYDGREIMFIIDESEYLKKWDVSKFDTLRKIWDNTKIPILFVGTEVLEDYLTHGGSGKENLSQLYRRIYKMRLEGIKEKEVREILSQYNIDKEAGNLLVALAIDYKHGGMGNFTEVLEMCLEETKGEVITGSIVRNAKNYKMLY